jgi:cysteine desulfurase
MEPIYLDYNASTPIAPEAAEEIRALLAGSYGNPSSLHWAGRPAREVVDRARRRVAEFLGASPEEIVFTSGGSESNNAAIKGVFFAATALRDARDSLPAPATGNGAPHFITSSIEHPAVRNPLRFLERLGARVTVLPVDHFGRVDPEAVARAITPETVLITIMHANNEVGTIEPIEEIAALARSRRVLFHTDAAQSAGKIPVDVRSLGVDLLSLAGHKVYAPKGVGALYVRRGVSLEPLVHGADHEAGRRAGTENVLLIAALGKACDVASGQAGMERIRELRDRFERELFSRFPGRVTANGDAAHRLPNTLSVNFAGRPGAEILESVPAIAASTGSACHAGSVRLSPVLEAMGVPPELGMGAVRFSLGRFTTSEEIDRALDHLAKAFG